MPPSKSVNTFCSVRHTATDRRAAALLLYLPLRVCTTAPKADVFSTISMGAGCTRYIICARLLDQGLLRRHRHRQLSVAPGGTTGSRSRLVELAGLPWREPSGTVMVDTSESRSRCDRAALR